MAQPFDFGALLQNPAFIFGSNLLANSRQPNAIGGAFSQVQKLQEMQMNKQMQQAQIQNMQQQRAAEEERARIAQAQYERQLALTEQQVRQAQSQADLQQRVMQAMQAQGLLGDATPEAAPLPAPAGATGMSAEYQPHPPNVPYGGEAPSQPQISPVGTYDPNDPRDPAGPFTGNGRDTEFGIRTPFDNQRPMRKTRFGTPSRILDNLVQVESSGGKNLIGPKLPTGERALGPYQFLPSTIDALAAEGYPRFNPFDPTQARDAADYYIQKLQRKHGGDLPKALAAYGGFVTKDATPYVQKVLGDSSGPIPAGSIKPPTTTPAIPAAGQRAVDIGKLGMLAGLGGVKGAAQIMEFGKMLQPQNVSPGSYQRDPSTGQLTFVPNPYEERRIGNDEARIGLEQQRVGLEQQRNETAAQEKNIKQAAAREADVGGYQDLASSMDRLYTQTDELLRHPGLPLNTGLSGIAKVYNLTPSGRDASALLDSVKNKLVIDTMLKMKALSKTGSTGFGQLSEKEGARLETYVVNLSRAQTQPAMQKALNDIKQFALESKGAFANRIKQTYGEDAVRPPAPAAEPPAAKNVMSLDEYIAKHRK